MLTERDCGITSDHIPVIEQIAREMKCFILARPVNEFSTGLIRDGFATKGLDIHSKSSDWGPMAGFICLDQGLSKVAGDAEKVKKGNEDARHSVKSPHIGATPLRISRRRVEELQDRVVPGKGHMVIPAGSWFGGASFECRRGDAVRCLFKLRPDPTDAEWVFVEYDDGAGFKAVQVIGYSTTGVVRPVTADYDLFAICPHFSAGGSLASKLTLRSRGLEGMLTDFQRKVKNQINAATSGEFVVNHGTELNNPFPEKDPLLAMFTPGASSRMVQRTKLYEAFADMAQRGFHTYTNRLWHVANRSMIDAAIQQRVRNPMRRGDLRPRELNEDEFGGLDLRSYPLGATLVDKMEHFAGVYLDAGTSGEKPRWH